VLVQVLVVRRAQYLLCYHTVHSTQYTVHSTQYTVHRTQYTVYSTQYTVHSTQYTVHSTQQYPVRGTRYSTQYRAHGTQYTVHSKQYTVNSTHSVENPRAAPLPRAPGTLCGARVWSVLRRCRLAARSGRACVVLSRAAVLLPMPTASAPRPYAARCVRVAGACEVVYGPRACSWMCYAVCVSTRYCVLQYAIRRTPSTVHRTPYTQ